MMRFSLFIVLCLLSGALIAQPSSTKLSPEVRAAFSKGSFPDVLVAFSGNADLSEVRRIKGKAQKAAFVSEALSKAASQAQENARNLLRGANLEINSFYLVNAISIRACPLDIAQQLASLPEVKAIALDPAVQLNLPEASPSTSDRGAIEWGIEKINAPLVWNLGYNGQGITIGGADTGYDWLHPALQPHYRGYNVQSGEINHNYHWHDGVTAPSPLNGNADNPCGFNIKSPCDDQSHGTHTMGTMTGDDGMGNQIGVAPGAAWVGCRNMERGWGQPSTYLDCFEWFLAPTDTNDLNPDPSKAPHVINNSWYCAVEEGCTDLTVNELLRTAVINLKLAGVVVVVSNGNAGGQGCSSTFGPPAYFEESFSIGASREDDAIAGFSSLGPVTLDNSYRIKPNVVAPGQGVRSSVPGNGYASFSGTSMAGPHVAGLVALLLSANPALEGEVEIVESIIEETCVPFNGPQDCSDSLGLAYPNNTFGYGRVDALAAVQKALQYTSTKEPEQVETNLLFPNPTAGSALLKIGRRTEAAQFRVMDGTGKAVFTLPIAPYGPELLPIQLGALPNGLYFYQLSDSKGFISSGRFTLQK